MQRKFSLGFSLLLALYIITLPGFAQDQRDQNWYFGNSSKGIQFSQPGDTARLVNRPTAGVAAYGTNGGAVASDPVSGGLLFYTDGSVVFDATHRAMPNGAGLGGNPAGSQPAVIVAIPGQADRYYIITNDATPTTSGQLRFSEVDMTLMGNNTVNPNLPAPPLGDVNAVKASSIASLDNEAEAMMIIPHNNGTDFWLITQEAGTDNFNISTITAAGITGAAAPTPAGTGLNFRATHFAYHAATGKLAVVPADQNRSVMIFTFDDATGVITFDQFVFNTAVGSALTPPMIYDVEWSNTGDYLYVSTQGDVGTPGTLIQYDMVTTTVTPVSVLPQSIARSYGLQMAPDSSIYHIYQQVNGGPFLVGKISDPDTVAAEVNYVVLPLGNNNFNARQFPGFLAKSKLNITLDFTVSGTCANAPSTFFPVVTPGADSLQWAFGDGQFSNQWSPTYTYTAGQTYPVTLKAYHGGDSTMVTKNVTIIQFDLQLQLVSDTTACSCELRFPKADPPPPPCTAFSVTATATGATGAIQWYGPNGAIPGATSLTLSPVDSAGFYYVIAQDPSGSGCAAYAGVNIKEYGVDDPRANIWYFGNNGGINFNPDFNPGTGADPIPGDLTSAEGSAVICDRNGQILFSTNGEQVFDRDGNPAPLLPQPPGLGGSQNSTQSALIIPVPNDPTLYYIFVTQEVYPVSSVPGYELRYAIFDLKKGANGELVDPDNDLSNGVSTALFTMSTERITGNNNWLIAHEYGNNNFRAYPITALGLGTPVISSIGSDHSLAVAENAQGYMKLGNNGILAVALSTPGVSNVVEIFDFDNATGAVTNFRQVDLQQPAGQVYGIEFSSSGAKLFASTIGATGGLHEFAYDSATSTYVTKPTIPVQSAPNIGAIQMGPDGSIYVAIDGSSSLKTIQENSNPDAPSTFGNDFALAGGTSSTLGLPNFMQNIVDPIQTPTISATGLCFGAPTDFMGTGTDPIDTLTWFFGDGASAKGVNMTTAQHTYGAPGTYIVTLRISNRCVGFIDNLTDTITINAIPTALSGAITLCTGTETIEATPSTNPDLPTLTFLWNTGDTTRVITPPAQGTYTVTVTSAAGCTSDGSYLVADNRPQADLGPDQTLCENTPVITHDAQNPGSTYEWRRNGVIISNAQTIQVPTSAAGTFKYNLTVFDPFTTCTLKDSVTYVINPDAQFTTSTSDPTSCNATDGSISVTITSTGTYSYTIVNTADMTTVSSGDQTGPGGPFVANGLSAGAYNVSVGNQVTGCFDQRTVPLSDPNFTVSIARGANCNDANNRMPIQISTSPAQGAFTYRIVTSATTTAVATGTEANNPTIPLSNGSYAAEVTNASGCTAVSPVTPIRQDTPVPIDAVNINACSTPITVAVTSPGTTFTWSGPNLTGPTPNPETSNNPGNPYISTMTANPPIGLQNYRLIITGAVGSCPKDTTMAINVGNDPSATLTQSSACEDIVTLTATPTGNYVYRWFRDGILFQAGQQIQITTADNGSTYTVEARNTQTACIVSTDLLVAALGQLTVDIINNQPCEGTDFDLTARVNQTPDSFQWRLDNNVIASETDSVLTVTDESEGLYKVIISRSTAGQTCTAMDSVQITIAQVEPGLLPDTGIICPDPANPDPATRTVTLYPGDYLSYQWFQDGVAVSSDTAFVATETGTYEVDLVNSYGCPNSDRITLIEECDPRITGPNAFRPDGSLNKEFFLFTFFVADSPFEIFIYNRWGEMVFHSDQRDFRWNGGYNNQPGQPLPPGTYTYLIKYKSSYRPEQDVEEHRGGVVLLR